LDERAINDLKKAVRLAGSMSAYAREIGVTRQYIHAVLSGKQPAGPKILDALSLRVVKTTVRK